MKRVFVITILLFLSIFTNLSYANNVKVKEGNINVIESNLKGFINYAYASDCMTCEERADGLRLCSPCMDVGDKTFKVDKADGVDRSKAYSIEPTLSPEAKEFIEGTWLSHAAGLPDANETVESLKVYLEESKKVELSIKKRFFSEDIDTGGLSIESWLEGGIKHLLSVKEKYPESRYVSEALGGLYREMYEYTKKREYLVKAVDAYIHAEMMGIKHRIGGRYPMSYYTDAIADILTMLGEQNKLNEVFSEILKAYPEDFLAHKYYAKALSKFNDPRADNYYRKAMALEPSGPFDSAISYAEYLLSKGKYEESIDVLNKIDPLHEFYEVHFLRGYAYEKMNKIKEAEKEYKKYLESIKNIILPDLPSSKYKIPGSKLQKDIEFKDDSKIDSNREGEVGILDIRPTPCPSTDWQCKSYWYGIWTADGEARGGTKGMHRAVAWNIRTRVFSPQGQIYCNGRNETCFNYAHAYPLIWGNVDSLNKRYFYVIETGGYKGLTKYPDYTKVAVGAWNDVYYGKVPDPIYRACYKGIISSGNHCDGICSQEAGLWGAFWADQSGVEFRAGELKRDCNMFGCCCQKLIPMDEPKGGYCGKSCYTYKGVVCPELGRVNCSGCGYYYLDRQPIMGNFFWSFNK